jgi:D-glycero-D-manno-heptose 1,7-bisphosphate phosphatase
MKAFFFDRDGIVNQRIMGGYVCDTEDFILLEGFVPLFQTVKQLGYKAIIITNQQGIGKGLMTEADLERVHHFMQTEIHRLAGSSFDDIFVAPELDSSQFKYNKCCGDAVHQAAQRAGYMPAIPRRKPSPAMILEAAERWNITPEELASSWIIGDSISDVQAGRAAGCRTILVGDYAPADAPEADFIVPNLAAARLLVQQQHQ